MRGGYGDGVSARTWIALLRAVNLGPRNKIAMADLKALLAGLGYDDVRTHLQSGNALFSAAGTTAPTLEREIAAALKKDAGLDVAVLVRSAAELEKVVAKNPFADHDPKQLHVVFLATKPDAAKVKAVDPARYGPDEFALGDRCVYVRLPNGVQGARFPDWDRLVGVPATMRTWRTVTRLAELAALKQE